MKRQWHWRFVLHWLNVRQPILFGSYDKKFWVQLAKKRNFDKQVATSVYSILQRRMLGVKDVSQGLMLLHFEEIYPKAKKSYDFGECCNTEASIATLFKVQSTRLKFKKYCVEGLRNFCILGKNLMGLLNRDNLKIEKCERILWREYSDDQRENVWYML